MAFGGECIVVSALGWVRWSLWHMAVCLGGAGAAVPALLSLPGVPCSGHSHSQGCPTRGMASLRHTPILQLWGPQMGTHRGQKGSDSLMPQAHLPLVPRLTHPISLRHPFASSVSSHISWNTLWACRLHKKITQFSFFRIVSSPCGSWGKI